MWNCFLELKMKRRQHISYYISSINKLARITIFLRRKMATDCIGEVGPWGGNGAGPWTFKPDGRISEIRIASGHYIDSIRFVYEDQHQTKHHSPKYGGDGGTEEQITFDEDEELNEMSGTTGGYVVSLSFRTNKGTYGPYGTTDEGTSFSLPVLAKGKFVGFFGECGDYLDSIGAILQF